MDPTGRAEVVGDWLGDGLWLLWREQYEEAIAVYEDIATRFGDAPDPALRREVASALSWKAMTLRDHLDRPDEALDLWAEVIAEYGDDADPGVRSEVAYSLINRGALLGSLARPEEEMAHYRRTLVLLADAPEPQQAVAIALNNLANALRELDRPEEVLPICDEIIARYGEVEPWEDYADAVARALVNKGVALGRLDRHDEERAVYQEVIARFGDDNEYDLVQEEIERAQAGLAQL